MSGTGEVKDTNKVNGPWDKIKNNESKQLRPPKSSPSDLTIPVTANEASKDEVKNECTGSQNLPELQNHKILNSTLNANAAEFVPLSNQNLNSVNHTNQDDQFQDVVLYLKEELNYLILNPGKYDEVVQPLQEVIEPYLNNENALQLFISVIIDECISEPNLRYNGARLCSDSIKKFGNTFRAVLLRRCQEEHAQFVENEFSNDGNFMNKIQGFGMVLAELFLQIQIGDKNISVLGQGLLKILQIILKNETEKGVKSVCQILKLAGKKLEEIADSKPQLNELFARLQSICNYVDLDPNLRFIVTSVLDMRASNWGENSAQQSPAEETQSNYNDPKFFGPDGKVISEEESSILQKNVPYSENKQVWGKNSTQQSPAEEIQSNSEFYNDPVFFGPDGKVISEEETSFLQESVPFSEDTEDYVCEQEMDEEVYNDFQKFLNLK